MAEKNNYQPRVIKLIHSVEDSFLVVLLSTMIVLAVTQIILRNFFDSGLIWIDPLLRLLVLWVGLAGAMLAARQDHHISIDVFTRSLGPTVQMAVRVFIDLFTAMVAALIAFHGMRLVQMDREAGSIAFAEIPSWYCELIIPVAFAVIALRYLIFTFIHARQLLQRETI